MPDDATQDAYYSTDTGPHGERDDLYILTLDEPPTSGFWAEDSFDDPLNSKQKEFAKSVMENSDTPDEKVDIDHLACRDVKHESDDPENDILLPCRDSHSGKYIFFERFQ